MLQGVGSSARPPARGTYFPLSARGGRLRLDAWLRNEAQANDTDRVPVKRIYQYGPNCVRDSRELRAALAILAERGRARMEEGGRRRTVAINPAPLDDRL